MSYTHQETRVHSCIPELLEARCQTNPEAIAIRAPKRSPLTYRQLLDRIHDAVTKLNSIGLSRNDRVALVLPNGPEMAVAFLASASGATCAPLNPAYRDAEFDFYLSDLDAKALIIQEGMDSPAITVALGRGIPILELSPIFEAPAGVFTLTGGEANIPANSGFAQSGDVALVLHTSGTTSRPKMVPLTHRNLCTSADNIHKALALAEEDICLNIMPLFHIHGLIGTLLSSLTAGATVVCTPGFDAAKFFEWMAGLHPTWYSAVPTMHQAILAEFEANYHIIEKYPEQYPLRFIRSSSAALPSQVMAALEQTFNAPVIEAYGMTEASHQMTSNPLPPGDRKPGSVGLAAGLSVAIMDEVDNLLPKGEIGEVVIQGASVTQGYENNPEANAKAFTNGWFRTGDQGYIDEQGYLFLKGRLKEIISRGAEKISPLEVDEVLMELPGILQAVTFAVPHPTLGEDVAAAVVLKENIQLSPTTIRQFLFERLADFKVPSQVLIIDEIPKGATGKLQRIGLAEKLAAYLQRDFIAPSNELEEAITGIFSEVLGIEKISVADNFFALGGDSLSGTRVVVRISANLNIQLVNVVLFQKPTVAELAQEVVRLKEIAEATSIGEIIAEIEDLSEEEIQQLLAEEV
jgi:acyl-CoA synthetase (AMP-forming)/AMP-acid ligase II/acyl carrier protein